MHAIHATPQPRRPAPLPSSRWSPPTEPSLLSPESFRERVEAEITRHDRYLIGFGLLRIGPRVRRGGSEALLEAIASEVRRTDSSCSLPDGSCALLALHAGQRELRAIVRRLVDASAEIEREQDNEPTDLIAALYAVRDRRVTAADMWLSLSHAFEQSRTSADAVVLVP